MDNWGILTPAATRAPALLLRIGYKYMTFVLQTSTCGSNVTVYTYMYTVTLLIHVGLHVEAPTIYTM